MTDSGALETDGSSDKFSVNQLVETTPSGTRTRWEQSVAVPSRTWKLSKCRSDRRLWES